MSIAQTGGNLANNLLIPEVWSLRLQDKFYAESLVPQITNSNYAGEVSGKGDKVHIRKRPNVGVNPYVANTPTAWQDVVDEELQFTIDYAYSAAVKVDKVKLKQMDINIMSELQTEIAKRQMNQEDTILFGAVYADATSTVSSGGALQPIQGTANYIMAEVAQLRTKLDRLNVDRGDRFLVVTPELEELMIQASAARFDASGYKNDGERYGKFAQKIYGFDVYVSNFIPGAGSAGNPYKCIAGQKAAITFARQVTEVEILPQLETYYGSGIKSLNVFGYKTVVPDALVRWNARTA